MDLVMLEMELMEIEEFLLLVPLGYQILKMIVGIFHLKIIIY
jgi:hypothetical protein